MSKLECGAKNCVHNDEHYCCISSICVGGSNALNEAETCCRDFVDQKDSVSNSYGKEKNPEVNIACRATNCVYNEEQKCHADAISICGNSANNSEETRCGTFKLS